MGPNRIYGLDIETDTTVNGLDPRVAPVVAVALATSDGTAVFTGAERDLLDRVESTLATLEPGVLVTWNGAGFDLPFLVDRARVCGAHLSLELADAADFLGADLGAPVSLASDAHADIQQALVALGYSDKEAALADRKSVV